MEIRVRLAGVKPKTARASIMSFWCFAAIFTSGR